MQTSGLKAVLMFFSLGLLASSCDKERVEEVRIEKIRTAAESFVRNFWSEDFDVVYDQMAENMRQQIDKRQIRELHRSLSEEFGGFERFSSAPQVRLKQEYFPVVLRCQLGTGQLDLQVTLNEDLLVTGLHYDRVTTTEANSAVVSDSLRNSLVRIAIDFANNFWLGQLDSAYAQFSQTMKNAVPFSEFSMIQAAVLNEKGAFLSIDKGVGFSRKGEFHLIVLTCRFEKGIKRLQLAIDATWKIGGMFFV